MILMKYTALLFGRLSAKLFRNTLNRNRVNFNFLSECSQHEDAIPFAGSYYTIWLAARSRPCSFLHTGK
jgi:hypothetical protein